MLSGQALALSWCKARPLPAVHSVSLHHFPLDPLQTSSDWGHCLQASGCLTIVLPLLCIWPSSKWKAIHTSALKHAPLPPRNHHHHYHHHSKGPTLCLYLLNRLTSCLLLKLLSSFAVMGKRLCHHILCSSWHYLRSVQGQSSNLCLTGVYKNIFFFLSTKSGFF